MKIFQIGALTEVTDYTGGDSKDWKSKPVAVPFFDNNKSEFIIIESNMTPDFERTVSGALNSLFSVDENLKQVVAVALFEQMLLCMDSIGYQFDPPALDTGEKISWESDHEHEGRLAMSKLAQIDLLTITEAHQVWSVVYPFEILVATVENTDLSDVYIQIQLKTVWDDEHGIEFVLKNGTELVYVGEPVWPLTEYDLTEYKK